MFDDVLAGFCYWNHGVGTGWGTRSWGARRVKTKEPPLRPAFDRRIRLEFHGARITSDGGLLAYRELDDALGHVPVIAGLHAALKRRIVGVRKPAYGECRLFPKREGIAMRISSKAAIVVGLIFSGLFGFSATVVGQTTVGIAEYRALLMDLATLVDMQRGGDPTQRAVSELTPEELRVMYDAVPDLEAFKAAVENLTAVPADQNLEGPAELGTLQLSPSTTFFMRDDPLDDPLYPSGGGYNIFVATLQGLGFLIDESGDGQLNDERCQASKVGDIMIAISTFEAIEATLVLCSALPPIADKACFAGATVNALILTGLRINLAQCNLQDALVDSAEIQAGYQNTVFIWEGLEQHDAAISSQLTTHDTDIKVLLQGIEGKVDTALEYLLDAIRLLHTPEGRRSSQVPACDGGPCDFPDR